MILVFRDLGHVWLPVVGWHASHRWDRLALAMCWAYMSVCLVACSFSDRLYRDGVWFHGCGICTVQTRLHVCLFGRLHAAEVWLPLSSHGKVTT